MDWQAEITAAAGRIAPYLRITPVMEAHLPGAGRIALKLENTQHTGSFKAQGTVSVLVTDQAIAEAQALLWRSLRQLVEPAGATALAALTSGAYVPEPGERVAVLVCGANPAPDPLG